MSAGGAKRWSRNRRRAAHGILGRGPRGQGPAAAFNCVGREGCRWTPGRPPLTSSAADEARLRSPVPMTLSRALAIERRIRPATGIEPATRCNRIFLSKPLIPAETYNRPERAALSFASAAVKQSGAPAFAAVKTVEDPDLRRVLADAASEVSRERHGRRLDGREIKVSLSSDCGSAKHDRRIFTPTPLGQLLLEARPAVPPRIYSRSTTLAANAAGACGSISSRRWRSAARGRNVRTVAGHSFARHGMVAAVIRSSSPATGRLRSGHSPVRPGFAARRRSNLVLFFHSED